MTFSRTAALGVAAVLVLAACGESSDDGAGSMLAPPTPIRVSGTTAGATPEGQLGSDAAMSSMPAFVGYTYEASPGLPALPGNSTGYHYPTGATVDAARVAELAAALGVEGEPIVGGGADLDGLAWRVGPDDGTAPALTVGSDAQVTVYYSGPWSDMASIRCSDPAAPPGEDPDAAVTDRPTTADDSVKPDSEVGNEVCADPEVPANVPSADDAEALAADVLERVGLDPSAFEFETYADDWAASVTAWSRFDGVRSSVAWGFGFGGDGALQWMNGTLASPIATGPYPLIDLDGALQRLAEQHTWFGFGGGVEDLGVATTAAEAIPTETITVDPVPVDPVPADTMPVDPVTAESTTDVATLVDVRADLWWAWDEDGSVWLLPAYTFTDTDGRVFTVPAVTEEFLIVTEPVLVDPLPVDPAPVNPAPAPDEVPEPGHGDVIGLAVDEATAVLADSGLTLRVVIDNGTALAVTEDFSTSRVNVEVIDEIVVAVVSIG